MIKSSSKIGSSMDAALVRVEKVYRKNGLSEEAIAAALKEFKPHLMLFAETQLRQTDELRVLSLQIGMRHKKEASKTHTMRA